MAFAVVGILGHFSKTLLLFFLPQIFNFIYSVPQLFGIIPCPRHRLPKFNEKTGLLEPSFAVIVKKPIGVIKISLEVLSALRLLKIVKDNGGTIVGCSNFTILNLILVLRGPMKEDRLTMWMLGVQVTGSAIAFGIRYGIAGLFYDASRR
jgi:UDP-N-acetylglucosamine--dolichyl-phosphate N-acetylglucosaminephosphotransferase